MSLRAENITKLYGKQKALDNVSFVVGTGEIVGFLGPNGAGKSTMMKIFTSYIPQTSGNAYVCDKNVITDSLEIRKLIGYLPENNPLYLDMYVKEYLGFIAGIHKVANPKKVVSDAISVTHLEAEQHKKIGQLSKGYRQRVGLAQALLHNPQVLILDEPTSGLDPNQIIEIRNLIKQLGKEKTVLLSTHIMQEVEAICSRVIIINKGKIVADDTTSNIQHLASGKNIITVEFNAPVTQTALQSIKGVASVENVRENVWKITSPHHIDLREAIFKFAVDRNIVVLSLNKEKQTLEDVFQQLTHN